MEKVLTQVGLKVLEVLLKEAVIFIQNKSKQK
jgi:hypothetical protein